ncbi:MAG: leucine-rich repeat domain-containing protein [Treponema sp.]|nr:leucine-rich repeat domain-containing protein [Treponema sp.]
MKKKLILILALMSLMIFCSCVQKNDAQQGPRAVQQYNDESDFDVTGITDNTYITIIGYIGSKQTVNIPPTISGKPVRAIGDRAFGGKASITSVIIPNSVTSIGSGVFSGCSGLISINVDAANPNYSSQDGILYNKAKTGIIHVPRVIGGNVTIPAGVTEIGSSAFENCTGLTSVTIPNSVTSIGGSAFAGCSGLTSVTIGNSVTSIGNNAFYNCSGLTSITIPSSVTSINYQAFSGCSNLTSVTFQGTITSSNFSSNYSFPGAYGDLRAKYLSGGIGTYTRSSGSNTWTKN